MKKPKITEPLTDENREYVEQVHNRTRKHVENHCRYLTHDAADAQDLSQDTYTALTKRVSSKGQLETHEYEKAYLRTIAKNTLHKQEKRKNQLLLKLSPNEDDKEKDEKDAAEKKAYEDYLRAERVRPYFEQFEEATAFVESKLTPEEWRVLKYKTDENLSDEDVGKLIGQSTAFVTYIYGGVRRKAQKWAAVFMGRRDRLKRRKS